MHLGDSAGSPLEEYDTESSEGKAGGVGGKGKEGHVKGTRRRALKGLVKKFKRAVHS